MVKAYVGADGEHCEKSLLGKSSKACIAKDGSAYRQRTSRMESQSKSLQLRRVAIVEPIWNLWRRSIRFKSVTIVDHTFGTFEAITRWCMELSLRYRIHHKTFELLTMKDLRSMKNVCDSKLLDTYQASGAKCVVKRRKRCILDGSHETGI